MEYIDVIDMSSIKDMIWKTEQDQYRVKDINAESSIE